MPLTELLSPLGPKRAPLRRYLTPVFQSGRFRGGSRRRRRRECGPSHVARPSQEQSSKRGRRRGSIILVQVYQEGRIQGRKGRAACWGGEARGVSGQDDGASGAGFRAEAYGHKSC